MTFDELAEIQKYEGAIFKAPQGKNISQKKLDTIQELVNGMYIDPCTGDHYTISQHPNLKKVVSCNKGRNAQNAGASLYYGA